MRVTIRLLEPQLELELYDDEHVRVTLLDYLRHGLNQPLELVLEDAALRELSRRRVTLRHEQLVERLNPGVS